MNPPAIKISVPNIYQANRTKNIHLTINTPTTEYTNAHNIKNYIDEFPLFLEFNNIGT